MKDFTCKRWLLFWLALLLASSSQAALLVSTNSVWKYRKGTNEVSSPSSLWRTNTFDDSGWTNGMAPFYYDTGGGINGNTLLNDMRTRYTCIFLRQSFVVSNLPAIGSLTLTAFIDDGLIAWINGKEIYRFNTVGGEPVFTNGTPSALEPAWVSTNVANPANFLANGLNLLAIQAFNRNLTSSDFVIDVELRSDVVDREPPAILSVNPPPGTVGSLGQVTVTFNEPVVGVTADDLLVNNRPASSVTGSGAVYTFTFVQPAYGVVDITWESGPDITDRAAPPNVFDETGAGWQYRLVDAVAPGLALVNPVTGATVRKLNQIEITFSEPVGGVEASDLLVNGQAATNVAGTLAGPYLFQFAAPATGVVQVAWSANHGILDLATPANPFGGGSWSYTLDPNAVIAQVVINEFLSATLAAGGLLDEEGELQDWIELYNTGTNAVNLAGWSLTDEADEPAKWTFPSVTLGGGQYLVVFASAKDRKATTPGARLHTNFKLNSAGDYLALFNAESPRQAMTEFRPEFSEQRNDYSYGLDSAKMWRYYRTPTPGRANGTSTISGVAPPPHFNVRRGFFERPFQLMLSCELSGATIRFTLDGSEPAELSGLVYTAPLLVTNTTILRAAAFQTGFLPSTIETHTYIFLEQVIHQPAQPPGLPTNWISLDGGNWPADYEMDPEIVTNALYSGLIKDALKALPSVSLVTRPQDMFDNATGIYPKAEGRGPSWERPASFELIFPDDRPGFQVDCGVQTQGNSARTPHKLPKHPFRIVFKGDYGPAKLNLPFFPDSPVTSFDTFIMRADFNFSWLHWSPTQRVRGQRTRDAWMKDSLRAMGSLASHNRYVHLYVNGLYWGVYDPTERPDGTFAASYLGGEKEEYDVVNEGAVVDGNMTAYNQMLAISNLQDNAQYEAMKQYLDVTQYIDYILLHFYVGHEDWGNNKNWYTMRRRGAGHGFKYVPWDGENILGDPGFNRVSNTDVASGLHTKLVANAQYKLDFADRAHKHFFNGGALMPEAAIARWTKRASEVDLAIIAESARWGDYRRDVHQYSSPPYELYTRNNHWLTEQNRLLIQYFPQRTGTVLNQLRAAGLYPNVTAPAFNQHGGTVPAGFNLTMNAPAGTIYYTTDGTDPRVYGSGAIAAGARPYSGAIPLYSSAQVKSRAFSGGTWSALNEAAFSVESLLPALRITEIMYNPNPPGDAYEFVELQNAGSALLDVGGFSFQGITYVFPPRTILAPGAMVVLASDVNPASFAARYPAVTVTGYFAGGLANGGERLAILDQNGRTVVSADYDDEAGWPPAADGGGYSLEIVDAHGDPDAPANWRQSSQAGGSPGKINPPLPASAVLLNEIMAENVSAVANGTNYSDWVELYNASALAVDLSGWSLSDRENPRPFVFPGGTRLESGAYLIVWCDDSTNAPGLHAGFALDRDGETVSLYDGGTNRLDAVTYGLQLADRSVGLVNGLWQLTEPTPGAANQAAPLAAVTNLVINEWLANAAPGQDDWLELYNRNTNRPVALRGLYLATSNAVSQLKALSFLAPGGYAQLRADEKSGPDHLDFKLPAEGGAIVLHDAAAKIIDRVQYGAQSEGVSQGRLPDGGSGVVSFAFGGSPGAANHLPVYNGPVLNEVMARNETAPADWIELRNPGAAPFDLSGMSLSVGKAQPGEWMFPAGTILPGNSCQVIWCDNLRPASLVFEADLNVGEGLSGESGGVYLFNTSGEVVDGVEYGFQIRGLSIGRVGGQWKLLAQPTPGQANAGAAVLGPAGNLKINEWMANPASGDDWFELYNPDALPVELAGLYLTDDPSLAGQAKFQVAPLSFIAPKSWVTFVADGRPSQGRDHVNFALDGEGEALGIYSPGLAPIDEVYFAVQALGASEGRLLDGGTNVVRFPGTASPGQGNYLPFTNIVFSEVLTHTDPPLEDAVELHNTGAVPVALGGWYLSNTPNDFKRYRIEEGVVIPPGGFHVFYEGPLLSAASGGGAYLFRAEGGEVYLSQADAAGNLTGYKAVARFGPIENGTAIGRYVTSVGVEFVALSERTFGKDNPASLGEFRSGTGLSNAYPRVGPAVISELMYHPPGESGAADESSTGEFVELHNITDSPVAFYDPGNPRDTWRLAGGIEFTFPTNVVLAPRGFLLVVDFDPVLDAEVLAAFREKHKIPAAVTVCGPFQGRLSNEGESIELYKFFRPGWPLILVDRVAYSNGPPWPAGADGTGPSLQRKAASDYGNDPVNWKADAPSPGRANSGDEPNASPVIESILVSEGKAAITWQAVPGKTYFLQYKTSLNEAVWKDLGGPAIAGTNRVSRVDDTFGADRQRFYRVICPATP